MNIKWRARVAKASAPVIVADLGEIESFTTDPRESSKVEEQEKTTARNDG